MGYIVIISSPFPPFFGFACVTTADLVGFTPRTEELACLSPRAVEKRRAEFFLGRLAARRALVALGVIPEPVGKGEQREPLWQVGVVGAITHKEGIAAAVTAREARTKGVGIDLEEIERPVHFGISRKVCTGRELAWVRANASQRDLRLKMLFSAKESCFKAFYPIHRVYLGYLDAEFRWVEDDRGFEGTLLKSAGGPYPVGYAFEVGCRIEGSYVMTWMALPPGSGSPQKGVSGRFGTRGRCLTRGAIRS